MALLEKGWERPARIRPMGRMVSRVALDLKKVGLHGGSCVRLLEVSMEDTRVRHHNLKRKAGYAVVLISWEKHKKA